MNLRSAKYLLAFSVLVSIGDEMWRGRRLKEVLEYQLEDYSRLWGRQQ
jgi:hypothetical protein